MYFITYNLESDGPRYLLHAIDVSTLKNVADPIRVQASGPLTNGHSYSFNPRVSRQRAGLLLSHGKLYAGFASFCDIDANKARGWVLGWDQASLAPLPSNELTDRLARSTDQYFLTSVWMSGYGLAASSAGDVYFVTGNSDPSGDSIDAVNNVAESAVQMSSDLSTIRSVFTPDNAVGLENEDGDFGSGGLMLLPPQKNANSNLAVAAGKDGQMYLLNADSLSNNNKTGPNRVLGTYGVGGCWCGQSYFTASDGTGRVVASGGGSVGIWKVNGAKRSSLTFLPDRRISAACRIRGSSPPFLRTDVRSTVL